MNTKLSWRVIAPIIAVVVVVGIISLTGHQARSTSADKAASSVGNDLQQRTDSLTSSGGTPSPGTASSSDNTEPWIPYIPVGDPGIDSNLVYGDSGVTTAVYSGPSPAIALGKALSIVRPAGSSSLMPGTPMAALRLVSIDSDPGETPPPGLSSIKLDSKLAWVFIFNNSEANISQRNPAGETPAANNPANYYCQFLAVVDAVTGSVLALNQMCGRVK